MGDVGEFVEDVVEDVSEEVGRGVGRITKVPRRTVASIEKGVGKIVDPGKEERKRAAEKQRRRIGTIEGILGRFAGDEGQFGTQQFGEELLNRIRDPRTDELVSRRLTEISEGAGAAGGQAARNIASATAARGVGLAPTSAFLQNQARLAAGTRGQLQTSQFLRQTRQQDLASLFALLGADVQRAGVLRGIKDPVVGRVSPFSVFKDLAAIGVSAAGAAGAAGAA